MTDPTRPAFHLEIHSLATFAAFVALIRGDDVDAATIAKLTATLKRSDDDLQAAVDAAAPPP